MRYPLRPWFHPLGMMATNPITYNIYITLFIALFCYVFRYHLADFDERLNKSMDAQLRNEAIIFYTQLDQMHKRQAKSMIMNQQGEDIAAEWWAQMYAEKLRLGDQGAENNYWHAHQRDAIRAETLLNEIRELKAKISKNTNDNTAEM